MEKMTKTRKRIYKGTLVASTNSLNKIISKRFIVNVYFTSNYKTLTYSVGDVRTSLLE